MARARRIERFLSQNTFVAKIFTGVEGSFVPLDETIEAFNAIADGKYDHVPEQAFFMCGGIEDLERKAQGTDEVATAVGPPAPKRAGQLRSGSPADQRFVRLWSASARRFG